MDPENNRVKLTLQQLFNQIEQYHSLIGRPVRNAPFRQRVKDANDLILALHNEITELHDSYPWKPWRPLGYYFVDRENMKVEIVDILFFLVAFMETWDIEMKAIEAMFWEKLKINKERLKSGYNTVKS